MSAEQVLPREVAFQNFLEATMAVFGAVPVDSAQSKIVHQQQSIAWDRVAKKANFRYQEKGDNARLLLLKHGLRGISIYYADGDIKWHGRLTIGIAAPGVMNYVVTTLSENSELAEKVTMDPGLAGKISSIMYAARNMALDVRNGKIHTESQAATSEPVTSKPYTKEPALKNTSSSGIVVRREKHLQSPAPGEIVVESTIDQQQDIGIVPSVADGAVFRDEDMASTIRRDVEFAKENGLGDVTSHDSDQTASAETSSVVEEPVRNGPATSMQQKGQTGMSAAQDKVDSPVILSPEFATIEPLSREEGLRFVQTVEMGITALSQQDMRYIIMKLAFPSFNQYEGRQPSIRTALNALREYFAAMPKPETHEILTREEADQRNFQSLGRVIEELQQSSLRLFPLFFEEDYNSSNPRHKQLYSLIQVLSKWQV